MVQAAHEAGATISVSLEPKEHPCVTAFKGNYEQIKHALEKHSSELCEYLFHEQGQISEKGLRHLLSSRGSFMV